MQLDLEVQRDVSLLGSAAQTNGFLFQKMKQKPREVTKFQSTNCERDKRASQIIIWTPLFANNSMFSEICWIKIADLERKPHSTLVGPFFPKSADWAKQEIHKTKPHQQNRSQNVLTSDASQNLARILFQFETILVSCWGPQLRISLAIPHRC